MFYILNGMKYLISRLSGSHWDIGRQPRTKDIVFVGGKWDESIQLIDRKHDKYEGRYWLTVMMVEITSQQSAVTTHCTALRGLRGLTRLTGEVTRQTGLWSPWQSGSHHITTHHITSHHITNKMMEVSNQNGKVRSGESINKSINIAEVLKPSLCLTSNSQVCWLTNPVQWWQFRGVYRITIQVIMRGKD